MVRRVVTGQGPDGSPTIVSDGPAPRSHQHVHTPGFANTLIWQTTAGFAVPEPPVDPTEAVPSFVPGPGETLAMTVSFPPDSAFTDPGFDPAAAGAEQLQANPGLAELFEADGMHVTPTVDYAVLISGTIVLDLGDGVSTELSPGDVVVQSGVRHAWRNPGDVPATMFFVLMGATG